jgi:signal transduction histidine kinase
MAIETEICKRYEAELAEIGALDRAYYQKPTVTPADRANYFKREERLEELRTQLYAALSTVRPQETINPPLFRVSVDDHANGKLTVSAPQCKLAHDLNNALGVILGRCELLEEASSTETGFGEHLESIRASARKIAGRIRGNICTERPPQTSTGKLTFRA